MRLDLKSNVEENMKGTLLSKLKEITLEMLVEYQYDICCNKSSLYQLYKNRLHYHMYYMVHVVCVHGVCVCVDCGHTLYFMKETLKNI